MNNRNRTSLDGLLQEQRRKQAEENRAQAILGSRSRTAAGAPRSQGLGASIASRAGVQRRPSSLPRTNSAPAPRAARPPHANNGMRSNRPREQYSEENSTLRDGMQDTRPPPPASLTHQQANPRPANIHTKSNGRPATNSFSVRGAARGEPYIVVGENFAFDTSAADIEAVMLDAGGPMHSCEIVDTDPIVAEMNFKERRDGQTVIDTFNGKKADSHTLTLYWKYEQPARERSPAAVGFVVDTAPAADDAMEVDEQTRDREEQNRLREERRGPAPRGPANDPQRDSRDRGGRNAGYPSGPSADRRGQYDSRSNYQNGGGGGRHYNGGGGRSYFQRGQGYQS